MVDDDPSGIPVELDDPLGRLAARLRMAEAEVLRRVKELVDEVHRATLGTTRLCAVG